METGLLDLHLTEDLTVEVLPADSEERFQVIECGVYTSQAGNKSLKVVLKATEHPNVDTVITFLGLPMEDDDEIKSKKKRGRIKVFCECFDIDISQKFDTAATVGAEGYIIVGEEEYEGTTKNTIKSFVSGPSSTSSL